MSWRRPWRDNPVSAFEQKLDEIITLLKQERLAMADIHADVLRAQADLTALSAAVTAELARSADLSAQLAAAIDQLKNAGGNPADVAAFEAVLTGIEAQTSALTAAQPAPAPVAAPAAPAPDAPPAPPAA